MAEFQDLLDAIAQVRAATGSPDAWQRGLSGADVLVATNPLMNSMERVKAVTASIRAAHPEVFGGLPTNTPSDAPTGQRGSAADAIRTAEASLARQQSHAAQLDLQVIGAILNAHSTNEEGQAVLDDLQRDLETAVAARTDLSTPAGAREFQHYLLGKLRDIRTVVETADVDATSKAALSAALASLYAAGIESPPEAPEPRSTGSVSTNRVVVEPAAARPRDPLLENWPSGSEDFLSAEPLPAVPNIPAASAVPGIPAAPVVPGIPAVPTMSGFGGGGAPPMALPQTGFAESLPLAPSPFRAESESLEREPIEELLPTLRGEADDEEEPSVADEEVPVAGDEEEVSDTSTEVGLPTGETITAASPELARVLTAVIGGTPIAEAFRQQDITIPAPGSVVTQPVDQAQLQPGDIGILTDRHAVALGNGKAVLNNHIQPIADVVGLNFLGWQHPPTPVEAVAAPDRPAPIRPELTAEPTG